MGRFVLRSDELLLTINVNSQFVIDNAGKRVYLVLRPLRGLLNPPERSLQALEQLVTSFKGAYIYAYKENCIDGFYKRLGPAGIFVGE